MIQYSPGAFFENSKNGVCTIKQVSGAFAIGANQQIIALVSLKKLLIISGWVGSPTAVASDFFFLSNGVQIAGNLRAAANSQVIFEPNPLGIIESTVSQNLALSVATAGLQYFFRYIEYTP
jgi:hypothetical protein